MRRSKLYVLLSIITLICLLGAAAICNLGEIPFTSGDNSENPSEETKEASEEIDITIETEVTEGSNELKQIEKQAPGSQAPTIDLFIYEGPTLSEDGICYFRIEAIVSGSPAPTVTFSKDDSNGTLGPLKTQINLTDPEDTYTLTATAENTSGNVASDILELSWGCSPAVKGRNTDPIVYDINITGGTPLLWPDSKYDIFAAATDPDGDELSFEWSVTGGWIDGIYDNPTVWNTPDSGGTYVFTASVDDGNGGTDSYTKSVFISETHLVMPLETVEFPIVTSEGGMFDLGPGLEGSGVILTPLSTPYAIGDTSDNLRRIAYISFDISGFSGAIQTAQLKFNLSSATNDPSLFGPVRVESVYWGKRKVSTGDLGSGWRVCEAPGPNFSADNGNLLNELGKAMEEGKERFQIKVWFYDDDNSAPLQDGDGQPDLWLYNVDDISLTVTYRP